MKVRLDQLLLDLQLASDLSSAKSLIGAGEVYVNDTIADKAGQTFHPTVAVRLKKKSAYVSRGGLKLEKALSSFQLSVEKFVCIDIGASSGGFTDCLLQHGAQHVFAVDVAYGQLAWKIRQDARVTVLERFNARKLTATTINNAKIQLGVIDVSFISLTKILDALFPLFPGKISIIALIKPQFELPKEDIGPKGVITDPSLHKKAIEKIEDYVLSSGYQHSGVVTSPILGPKGNTEFLIHIHS